MPYGDSMSYLPAMSRLMGEVEQPTNTGAMGSPQYGGSPEQLMQMMMSPHMQQNLAQWGIHFDPSQMRQSPFLPNSFMQGHPQLGGAMSGAMSNVAATPEAPLVSGAGSGMTRAMQGMMGGPELQRQYQIRQMLAPMQGVAQQVPAAEFQRKERLLDLLTQMEQRRAGQGEESLDIQRHKADEDLVRGGPKFNQVTGETWMPHPGVPGHPTQAPQQGGGGTMPSEGFGIPPGVINPAQAYQPAGYTKESADPSRIAEVSKGKSAGPQGIAETNVKGRQGVADTQARSRENVAQTAAGAKLGAAGIAAGDKSGRRYDQQKKDINDRYTKAWQQLSQDYIVARGSGNKEQLEAIGQQMQSMHAGWQQELDAVDKSHGGQQAGVVNPGAPQASAQPRTGGGQAGRPGATGGPQGQATAPAQQTDPTNPDFWKNAAPPAAPQQ